MVSVADKCDWTCSSAVEEERNVAYGTHCNTIFVVSAVLLLLRVQAHIQVPQLVLVVKSMLRQVSRIINQWNLLSIQLNVYTQENNYKNPMTDYTKMFWLQNNGWDHSSARYTAAEHRDSLSVTFHTDNDLAGDSPNVHFSNLWYAARTQNKVAQTIRKQYKHTIEVFELVSHTDDNCKVGRSERGEKVK